MDEALELLPLEGLEPAAAYAMSHGVPRHIVYKVLSAAPENQRSNLSRRKLDELGEVGEVGVLGQAEAA